MSDSRETREVSDADLMRLFAQMRDADASEAPAFPEDLAFVVAPPANEEGRETQQGRQMLPWMGALAAAVLVAFIAIPGPQSPEEVYLEVMSANHLLTDEMMLASSATLPEMDVFPGAFDTTESVDFSELFN